MNISFLNSVDQAHKAIWLTVVIDVFRAFTTEMYAFDQWASAVIPVKTLDEAYWLKKQHEDYLLMWERWWVTAEWFDLGNSPYEISRQKLLWKTLVHTTSNGTQWLLWAIHADEILIGSFVNVKALVEYIKKSSYETISLVSTSHLTENWCNEDILCAEMIRDALLWKLINYDLVTQKMRNVPAYDFLFNEVGVPIEDFNLSVNYDAFDFVVWLNKWPQQDTLIRL